MAGVGIVSFWRVSSCYLTLFIVAPWPSSLIDVLSSKPPPVRFGIRRISISKSCRKVAFLCWEKEATQSLSLVKQLNKNEHKGLYLLAKLNAPCADGYCLNWNLPFSSGAALLIEPRNRSSSRVLIGPALYALPLYLQKLNYSFHEWKKTYEWKRWTFQSSNHPPFMEHNIAQYTVELCNSPYIGYQFSQTTPTHTGCFKSTLL